MRRSCQSVRSDSPYDRSKSIEFYAVGDLRRDDHRVVRRFAVDRDRQDAQFSVIYERGARAD